MYEYITGRLEEITPTDAIVEACGIGYDLVISLSTFSKLQSAQGQTVKLYTYHQVREDDESLFGFADRGERSVFTQLISVSGVGAGSARMILSAMTADEVKEAILTGDVNRFKAVKGIGLKTAQRIIIDLKDKIGKGGGEFSFETAPASSPVREEAFGALTMLGFAKPAIEKTLDKLLKEKPDYTVEELIKRALKLM
ncbi:MAG: Holliday junction branch migration protein RuvA [Bacteroidales bacterium]|nr:Holliday junction branch migration protein RuvA [Bacteroidales bacterium]MBQ4013532.1 Holliday junction branch migration protein RuvA [Bacteroidales bacterium]